MMLVGAEREGDRPHLATYKQMLRHISLLQGLWTMRDMGCATFLRWNDNHMMCCYTLWRVNMLCTILLAYGMAYEAICWLRRPSGGMRPICSWGIVGITLKPETLKRWAIVCMHAPGLNLIWMTWQMRTLEVTWWQHIKKRQFHTNMSTSHEEADNVIVQQVLSCPAPQNAGSKSTVVADDMDVFCTVAALLSPKANLKNVVLMESPMKGLRCTTAHG